MKVKDLLVLLQKYNLNADFTVVIAGRATPFTVEIPNGERPESALKIQLVVEKVGRLFEWKIATNFIVCDLLIECPQFAAFGHSQG